MPKPATSAWQTRLLDIDFFGFTCFEFCLQAGFLHTATTEVRFKDGLAVNGINKALAAFRTDVWVEHRKVVIKGLDES